MTSEAFIYAYSHLKLETVQYYTYLGSKITCEERSDIHVEQNKEAKQASYKKENVFTVNTVRLNTKKTHIKNFI